MQGTQASESESRQNHVAWSQSKQAILIEQSGDKALSFLHAENVKCFFFGVGEGETLGPPRGPLEAPAPLLASWLL